MRTVFVNSHETLQKVSDELTEMFSVQDPFVLRAAIVEAIQNTVQHSDGLFRLDVGDDRVEIINLVKPNGNFRAGLGLQMYGGISTFRKGSLFHTVIKPTKVKMNELSIPDIMKNCCNGF